MLYFVASITSFAVCAVCAVLGLDYITIGYGLNPWLAFPISGVFGVLSISCMSVAILDYQGYRALRSYHALNK